MTDIQLKYTPEGKFRQFAFIGYQNEEQANESIKYFDKMCINTYRLNVSHCVALGNYLIIDFLFVIQLFSFLNYIFHLDFVIGDASKPKAWSKYAPEHKSVKNVNNKQDKEADLNGVNKKNKKKATNLLEKVSVL